MTNKDRYTAAEVASALKRNQGLVGPTATALHCSPQTVRNYIERYSTVRDARKEAREGFVDKVEIEFFKHIQQGNLKAIIYALKTLGKDRGYVERIEVEPAVEREVEAMIEALEDGLAPDEFRKVAGILAGADSRPSRTL